MSIDIIPEDSIWIYAKDIDDEANGSYKDDSIRVKLNFSDIEEGNYWYQGFDKIEEDFVLKRK